VTGFCAAPRHQDQDEPAVTGCTGRQFGDHDYSQPPHNTPDDPRDAPDETPCQAVSAQPPFGSCQHTRDYEVVIFQIATHAWIRLFACTACTATLRTRHQRLGPGGTDGIHRIRNVR
jgi:hypothetical protein